MLIYVMQFSFLLLFILLFLLVWNRFTYKRTDSIRKQMTKRRRLRLLGRNSLDLYARLDILLQNVPVLKGFYERLQSMFVFFGEKDKRYIRRKSVQMTLVFLFIYIILILLFSYVTRNIFYSCIFMFFLWYVSDSYSDYILSMKHERLLKQMLLFLGNVRHKYYEFNAVDETIYEALELLDQKSREMSLQAERIYDIFTDIDIEYAVTRYMEIAPSPYLKMFVGFSRLTLNYGDQKDQGQSVYLMNISFLMRNIQLELEKRQRLNYGLKAMNIIVMIPLFFMSLLRQWAEKNFEPLQSFYASMFGKYMEIATIAVILLSMFLLNKIQKIDYRISYKSRLYTWLLRWKIPFTQRQKKQWLYAILGMALSFLLLFSIRIQQSGQIKNQSYYQENFMSAKLSENQVTSRREESRQDYEFVKTLANNSSRDKREVLIDDYLSNKTETEGRKERIEDKVESYEKIRLSWWQVLLCILAGILAYNFPLIDEWLNNRIRSMDKEDEIVGFQNIIMMLVFNERMNTEELLDWMLNYSNYYREPLNRCQLNLSSGTFEAFIRLREEVDHPEMKKLANQLALASEDISIKQAFDELVSEKANYYNHRKWINERMVKRKLVLGQNIGFMPANALIVLYLIVPMIVSSSQQLELFFRNM